MENRDELIKRLAGQMAADAIKRGDKTAQIRLYLEIFALLAFVGEEAVQVIFRKNFGSEGLSRLRLIVCFILFEIIALLHFAVSPREENSPFVSSASFIAAGVFYLLLGVFVLRKGFRDVKRAKSNRDKPPKFAGESNLLSFLIKDGHSQSKVQYLYEPVLTIAIGVFFMGINPFWGIPIIYCGISVWLCWVVEALFESPSNSNQPTSQMRNYSDAD